jgi:Flp pilus assembly protein TadB
VILIFFGLFAIRKLMFDRREYSHESYLRYGVAAFGVIALAGLASLIYYSASGVWWLATVSLVIVAIALYSIVLFLMELSGRDVSKWHMRFPRLGRHDDSG